MKKFYEFLEEIEKRDWITAYANAHLPKVEIKFKTIEEFKNEDIQSGSLI